MKAKTLKTSLEFRGLGVHSGEEVRLLIEPRTDRVGFLLVHEPTGRAYEAVPGAVVETRRYTGIGTEDHHLKVTEHVLSALFGLGVDAAVLRFSHDEAPFYDGSALEYARRIAETPHEELDAEVPAFAPADPVFLEGEDSAWAQVTPADAWEVLYGVSYRNGLLQGALHLHLTPETYLREIAPARTFLFEDEVEALYERGLARGGSLDNALVFRTNGSVMNPDGLRFADEPVRHKILDLVGDLALGRHRPRARFVVWKGGHALHVALARRVAAATPNFDIREILRYMPHRYPFLLVDRVLYLDDTWIQAVKNVTMNEPFFTGHFPENPIMPGVLIVEALAQAGGFLLLHRVPDPEGKLLVFAGLDKVRFRHTVRPGDRLILEGELLRFGGRLAKLRAVARVGTRIVAEGEFMASVVDA